MPGFRLVHLSDVHVWKYEFNPLRLMNKRAVGMAALLLGRARRFRMERLRQVVERVESLAPDHVLITGDLTTTALAEEFALAFEALRPLLRSPERATVVPGNHDRYTRGSARGRRFERSFGPFLGGETFPWLRFVADRTAVLALDPSRPHLSARGRLPAAQLAAARELWEANRADVDRLVVACHYPIAAPPGLEEELAWKRLENADELTAWLATIGPHLYCCGHVHHAWAFTPPALPDEVCLNAGAPLLLDRRGDDPPGFLEIVLDGGDVAVTHHGWTGARWIERPMARRPGFFARRSPETSIAAPG
ncbi:metallophosphoesterase family protein [Paludisphaera mucosa]|uniref:Metallophosphoesterase n=1 Tax=Paludisphaera mucosa TaxID=3030827 RepID=A0ABT6FGT4_9BACT|nr:metallophosphoesterase [Paludisphaera mucosa]MDG3006598.1 metallophosphoesterase [Paludisphaera mucosa]